LYLLLEFRYQNHPTFFTQSANKQTNKQTGVKTLSRPTCDGGKKRMCW